MKRGLTRTYEVLTGRFEHRDPNTTAARNLETLTKRTERSAGVRKADLGLGDQVIVTTRNSTYSIVDVGEGRYRVSGGWFDRVAGSPATTTINGCTWGGTAIRTDLVAGRGLFLEFGNHVLTTRIQQVQVIRADEPAQVH